MESEKIFVAGEDQVCVAADGEGEELVVRWMAASGDFGSNRDRFRQTNEARKNASLWSSGM